MRCSALLAPGRLSSDRAREIEVSIFLFLMPNFAECFHFAYILYTASLSISERNILAFMKSLLNQSQHTCDFTINNQSYPEGEIRRQHIQGTSGCRLSPFVISPPPLPDQYTQRPDHNTRNYVPYSLRTVSGFFNVPQSYWYYEQGL